MTPTSTQTRTQSQISDLYAAFNRRDVDAALASMAASISWPKASEGGRVTGKAEIRAYWLRQWAEFDPTVDPVKVSQQPDGTVQVHVHQVVRNLTGAVLSDQLVVHTYTLADGMIQRMDLEASATAFPHPTS